MAGPTKCAATADEPQEPATGDPTPDDLGDAGKKALDSERKARRDAERKAADLEKRLQAVEDKDKPEVERLTKQIAALEKDRDQAAQRADRLEVAVLRSLDEDKARRITSAAKRLNGATREELEADADEFLTTFAVPDPEPRPAPAGKPREALKPGTGDPTAPVEETDLSKLGARMFEG
jgi:hypothetical protein